MKLLVCGTRIHGSDKVFRDAYRQKVFDSLSSYYGAVAVLEIVEGCCPNSADAFSEEFVILHGLKIHHFPSSSGNYLKRNIEMVDDCDEVLAFYDKFSYGTAHTIANAVLAGKPVKIVDISGVKR
jgi:hypothetical protein